MWIYNLEKLFKENSKLDEFEDQKKQEIEKVQTDISSLNELLKGEDFENIISSYQNLQKDFEKIQSLLNIKNQTS